MAKAEGKLFEMLDPSAIRTDFLEPFDFNEPREKVRVVTKEFSAVCPFSGLPDVAEVILEYHPDGGKCVELKSLKYYYTSFRPVGLYQEGVTKRIYDDLKALLGTERIVVTTVYNTRGGFDTTCTLGSLG